ncbi:hypothetical protein [Leptospira weilii]|uniref:hypothetical protein n=1 Tax=Leptospira weilii TaxID=28184 RepID=UPI001EF253A2|nr:hypothetical protein [Leptospira weilii]
MDRQPGHNIEWLSHSVIPDSRYVNNDYFESVGTPTKPNLKKMDLPIQTQE